MALCIANNLLHFLFHCLLHLLLCLPQNFGSLILSVSSDILEESTKPPPDLTFAVFFCLAFRLRIFIVCILAVIVVLLLETAQQ